MTTVMSSTHVLRSLLVLVALVSLRPTLQAHDRSIPDIAGRAAIDLVLRYHDRSPFANAPTGE